jgi:hypothetical protein
MGTLGKKNPLVGILLLQQHDWIVAVLLLQAESFTGWSC